MLNCWRGKPMAYRRKWLADSRSAKRKQKYKNGAIGARCLRDARLIIH